MAWPRTFFACLLSAAVLCAAAAQPPVADASARTRMVKTINVVRGWANVHGVHYSRRQSRRAASWARYLLRRGRLAHSSSAGGEVIEWHVGRRAGIKRAVGAWLRSPGHRRVILSSRYRRAGAGRAVGWMNGQEVTIWVVRFGRG